MFLLITARLVDDVGREAFCEHVRTHLYVDCLLRKVLVDLDSLHGPEIPSARFCPKTDPEAKEPTVSPKVNSP